MENCCETKRGQKMQPVPDEEYIHDYGKWEEMRRATESGIKMWPTAHPQALSIPYLIWCIQPPWQWGTVRPNIENTSGKWQSWDLNPKHPPSKHMPVTTKANVRFKRAFPPGWGKARGAYTKKKGWLEKLRQGRVLGQLTAGRKHGVGKRMDCHRLPCAWQQHTGVWITQLASCNISKFPRQHTTLVPISSD